jgi:hypothetical protein
MCRNDIREYRPATSAPATPSAIPPPLVPPREPPIQRGPPANMSIDSIDDNHMTFSYDLPINYNNDQIYQDIVNTVNYMAINRNSDDRRDDDDDIMEVD